MNENKVDPKEIEKVQKLLSDEEFVKKLISYGYNVPEKFR